METDEGILVAKAQAALRKYGHRLVIANLLSSRKTHVLLLHADGKQEEVRASEGEEIEEGIVSRVVACHASFRSEERA